MRTTTVLALTLVAILTQFSDGWGADSADKAGKKANPADPELTVLIDLCAIAAGHYPKDGDPNAAAPTFEVRLAAIDAISAFGARGKAAVPGLTSILKSPQLPEEVEWKSLQKLADEALENAKADPTNFDKIAALNSVREKLAPLKDALDSQRKALVFHLVRALGNIGPDANSALPDIVSAKKYGDYTLNMAIAVTVKAVSAPPTQSPKTSAAQPKPAPSITIFKF